MKKTYISPDATIVNLDIEGIYATSPQKVIQVDTDEEVKDESDFASGTYRTSLWGD